MNMHCASRLGWIRSSQEASAHASVEVSDPTQAGLTAASGRAPASAGAPGSQFAIPDPGTRTPSAPRPADGARHPAGRRPKRRGLLLAAAAALLLIPALAYADVPVASISGPETVAEGAAANNPEDAEYTVTLTAGMGSEPITIHYTVTGTATEGEGEDYTDAGQGVLVIPAATSSGTITITVLHDEVDEVGETMVVTLTDATTDAGTVAVGSPDEVTTTILPRDTVTVSVSDVSAAENIADGDVAFTVTLSEAISDSDVTLGFATIAGSATEGVDYTAAESGATVVITANEQSANFTVSISDDSLAEESETFSVKLTLVDAPDNVAFETSTATATITDDDALTAKVEEQQQTVVENSAATFTVRLERADDTAGAGSKDVVVSYAIAEASTATATDDYEVPIGMLTIPAGESAGAITITTHPDDLLEGDETLILTLTDAETSAGMVSAAAADTEESDGRASTTIRDPDGTVIVSVADTTAIEGSDAKFVVTMSGKVSNDVTVTYSTADGEATEGSDYTRPSLQTVVIKASEGETTGTITVKTLNADPQLAEAPETFTVMLTEVSVTGLEGRVRIGTSEATAEIRDNDVLKASVEGPKRVREGMPAPYTVTLAGGAGSEPVVVNYTVGGSATAGTDYTAPAGTLTIAADAVMKTIEIPTFADQELGETLVVTLTGVSTEAGETMLGTEREVATELVAADAAIISVADVKKPESMDADFVVKLSGTLSDRVKLRYETAYGTASAADFTAKSDTLTIPVDAEDGYTTTITVPVEDDFLTENAETFTLNLSLEDSPDDVLLDRTTAKAEITDDNDLTVSVASQQENVVEGNEATFIVTLAGGTSTADVTVKYEFPKASGNDVIPADKDDYQASRSNVDAPRGNEHDYDRGSDDA